MFLLLRRNPKQIRSFIKGLNQKARNKNDTSDYLKLCFRYKNRREKNIDKSNILRDNSKNPYFT